MIWLSDEAIEYAFAKCRSERGYKIIVAVSNRHKQQNVEYALRRNIRDTDEFNKVLRCGGNILIEFKNGSYIKVIPAVENARGYKCHLLIVDEYVDDEIINCVFKPMEILEEIERRRWKEYACFKPKYACFKPEYACLWEHVFPNIDNDEEIADVSEEEFMKILNIPLH